MIASPNKTSLINTDAGSIVITGCAHPGIVKVIQKARDALKSSIYLALGGFHLKDMKEKEIDKVIERLKKEGIKRVGPCHCSGRLAMKLFKRAYGKDFLRTGVGTSVRVVQSAHHQDFRNEFWGNKPSCTPESSKQIDKC